MGSPEEIAFRKGWISKKDIIKRISKFKKNLSMLKIY